MIGQQPHRGSIIRTRNGREVFLKVHRGLWSGTYPENSLPAIEECYRAPVARLEIDLWPLHDADFVVIHDSGVERLTNGTGSVEALTRREAQALRLMHEGRLTNEHPPLFSEVVALISQQPYPSVMELDLQGFDPLPWPRVEELVRLSEPVRDRIIFNSGADWNLRRLLRIDAALPVGFDPYLYLDWEPDRLEDQQGNLRRGAYGYLDAHPLAARRFTPVADYLADRLGGVLRLVPHAREAHLRLDAFERMLDDGVADAAELFHREGLHLDVWTLDADTPGWRERLARVLAAGVDMVTTNTPRALATTANSGGT